MSAVLAPPRRKAAALPPPPEWDLLQPYRACDLCDHGIDIGSVRHCVCADVTLPSRPVPVHIVRAPYGRCGEGRYLTVRGERF